MPGHSEPFFRHFERCSDFNVVFDFAFSVAFLVVVFKWSFNDIFACTRVSSRAYCFWCRLVFFLVCVCCGFGASAIPLPRFFFQSMCGWRQWPMPNGIRTKCNYIQTIPFHYQNHWDSNMHIKHLSMRKYALLLNFAYRHRDTQRWTKWEWMNNSNEKWIIPGE